MKIPTYIKNTNQENYNELFNQTLRAGLSDNGWTVPNLTSAQITTIGDSLPVGTIWFDTDLAKLVVKTAGTITPPVATVIEVIQSV